MNRKAMLWFLLELMIAIIFYTLFFVVAGPDAKSSQWMSFLFFGIAFAFTVLTPFVFRRCDARHFLGIPVIYISKGYFALEFLLALFFAFLGQKHIAASLAIQLILCVLYCIVVISLLLINEYQDPTPYIPPKRHTAPSKSRPAVRKKEVLVLPEPEPEDDDEEYEEYEEEDEENEIIEEEVVAIKEKHKASRPAPAKATPKAAPKAVPAVTKPAAKPAESDSEFVGEATASLKRILNSCEDKNASREIERAYDAVRSSIRVSSSSVRIQEMAIVNKIAVLSKEVSSSQFESACDTAVEIMTLAEKRNKILRG